MASEDVIVEGKGPRVVDRHNETIGATANAEPALRNGPLVVELTDPVARLLGLEEGMAAVPLAWVAGIRRDEIRLSLAVRDPAFRASVLEQTRPASPDPATGQPSPLRSHVVREANRDPARRGERSD